MYKTISKNENENHNNNNMNQIRVAKRDGRTEPLNLNKIMSRIEKQTYNLDRTWIVAFEVAQTVIAGVFDGVTTRQLDQLAAETAASLTAKHPDYAFLAARLAITALHKDTDKSFSKTIKQMYNYIDPENSEAAPLVSKETYNIVMKHKDALDSAIEHSRDFMFDYFGFKTLEKSYLLRMNNMPAERPQFMWMRVAVGIHGDNLQAILDTYNDMSQGDMTHATPTLFNSGTLRPQMSSCFLIANKGDSMEGITDTWKEVAMISKYAGGVGLHIHDIRASGSYIKGTNGNSNGLVPMLKVYNDIARYVDQGGGKRKGSFAVYLEPWHADIMDFLELKKNTGKDESRARDLFYAIWMPDLFMEIVDEDGDWHLMDPKQSPGLADVYGEEFNRLYKKYIDDGKFRKKVKAREIWSKILELQIETGTPYILYKDVINQRSNQKNIGTIKSSNLCAEILEVSTPEETAVCNLASIALPKFIKGRTNLKYDFDRLWEVAYRTTVNLNKVIDRNFYPTESAKRSNMRHRPIGLGTQGLADVFIKMRLPFASEEAKKLNRLIYETIYHAAVTASMELAKAEGPYETFKGSPMSKGIFQFDMWGVKPSDRYDWEELKEEVKKHGVRNSLLLAQMPTASTSSILGNTEAAEAISALIGVRKVLSGEFMVVNRYLVQDLIHLGLWNEDVKNDIIRSNGSIQNLTYIPSDIKEIYKTVWEISQKDIIDMYADRGAYIDQTQSMNLFMASPNMAKLTSMHFYAWGKRPLLNAQGEQELDEAGNKIFYRPQDRRVKTGMYYLRSKPATGSVKFSIQPDKVEQKIEEMPQIKFDKSAHSANEEAAASFSKETIMSDIACSLDDPDSCVACSA